MKKVKFVTLGCKVNQYETQSLREKFLTRGFQESNTKKADVYLINTCTVTHQADRESRHLIRTALKINPKAKVIVTGCYVEKDASEILQISKRIQIVPNQEKHLLLESLRGAKRLLRPSLRGWRSQPKQSKKTGSQQAAQSRKMRLLRPTFASLSTPFGRFGARNDRRFIPLQISDFQGHQRAFVKIQDGCNNFCSYCKVPFVRGRSRSRSKKEIIEEVTRLVNRDFKEIVLSGICLGDYHYRDSDLVDVLTSLEDIDGQFRVRLSSIEPQLISDKLIEKMANSLKICPHLHIPLQSGDNQILKKMNRQYTVKDFLSLISKIKNKLKDVAITTDVLVGFPGEEDKNFRNTIRCLKEIMPLRTHIFSFSPRQGTAAFKFQERIAPEIVKARVNLLKKVAQESSYKFRKGFLKKGLSVLIESQRDKENGLFCGYAENYIRVSVENASEKDINNLVQVEVKTVEPTFTKGVISHKGQ